MLYKNDKCFFSKYMAIVLPAFITCLFVITACGSKNQAAASAIAGSSLAAPSKVVEAGSR